jgi:hypothetical protein
VTGQIPLEIREMKRMWAVFGLLVVGCATPMIVAADDPGARAVFAMICTREGHALGHRDEALRKYVDDCVAAKLRVYDRDMLDPATAHIPKSC